MRLLLILAMLSVAVDVYAQDGPTFYSYVANSGRTVYVNRFSLIPPEKRTDARAVDLSEVSLNSELAEDLSEAVVREIRQIKESDPCAEARRESQVSAWRHTWTRHGPWILVTLAAAVLVMLSPWMIRRTPPGVWPRFLMVALPALAMTGLLAVTSSRASRSLEAVRELATLCDANEGEASAPTRLMRLQEMRGYIQQLYQQRFDELEKIGEMQ